MVPVPLSEDEQRILHEIERSFYENDPEFARGVSTATLNRHAGRNTKWSVAGFVVGLLVLLTQFASPGRFWLGAVGFLMMLGSAFVFVSNLRRLSRGGLSNVARSFRSRNFGATFSEPGRRLRQRFKRGDD
jgi:hypothetical protein